jgi:hypothetical protein
MKLRLSLRDWVSVENTLAGGSFVINCFTAVIASRFATNDKMHPALYRTALEIDATVVALQWLLILVLHSTVLRQLGTWGAALLDVEYVEAGPGADSVVRAKPLDSDATSPGFRVVVRQGEQECIKAAAFFVSLSLRSLDVIIRSTNTGPPSKTLAIDVTIAVLVYAISFLPYVLPWGRRKRFTCVNASGAMLSPLEVLTVGAQGFAEQMTHRTAGTPPQEPHEPADVAPAAAAAIPPLTEPVTTVSGTSRSSSSRRRTLRKVGG